MKAARLHGYGETDQLRYDDTEKPELRSPTDAIVELKAAAVNQIDIRLRRGAGGHCLKLPHILGGDGAGTVVSVGPEVKNVKPGDPVCLYPPISCGHCEFCRTQREHLCEQRRLLGERENGTYAQYVKVPARNCYPLPPILTFEEAAAFPLVYITAWRMLLTDAEIKPGESVLILGIGGGIATAALQIAAALGCHTVVTSNNKERLAMAAKFGAEHAINCASANFSKEVRKLTDKRGVDVVVNCSGGETWAQSLAALARGGRLVTCGVTTGANPQSDLRRVFWNHLKIFGSAAGTHEEFHRVLNFISASQTKPIIDGIYPLKEAARAQQRLEERKHFGKVVLRIDT